MRKIFILTGLLILGIAMVSYAYTIEAPHNKTNDITVCADCHGLPGYLPYDDSLCLSCHVNATGGGYSRNNAPRVLTHSSANTTPAGQPSKYGNWTIRCIDCHNQHVQMQTRDHNALTFLVTGTITSVSYDSTAGTTTFGYNNVSVNSPSWADPALWGRKSGNERGLIIYPNIADVNNPNYLEYATSYEIASATASTITVKDSVGTPSFSFATPKSFAIVYGQMVDTEVFKPITELTPWQAFLSGVRFFNQTGPNSFAHNDMLIPDNDGDGVNEDSSPSGVCQICHYNTVYWRFDGSKAATGVHAGQNGTNCMTCHPHAEGFKPSGACNTCHGFPPINNTSGGPDGLVNNDGGTGSTSAGAHARHATAGPAGLNYSCETCHTGGMPASPIFDKIIQISFNAFGITAGNYDGRTAPLANGFTYSANVTRGGTKNCSNIYCHSSGQGATADAATPVYATPTWDNPASGACGACHKTTSGTALGAMDTGSHAGHLAQTTLVSGCGECHQGATNTTYTSANHVNRQIDVMHSYTAGGAPGNGYGTCSVAACHGSGTPVWGTVGVNCNKCHGSLANGNSAPGPDTAGDTAATDPQVGAHQAHLQNLSGLTTAVQCQDCHVPVSTVSQSGHIKDSTPGVADVVFTNSLRARLNGAAPTYASGTCSTTYCHGGTMGSNQGTGTAPVWTDTAYLTGTPSLLGDCSKCHLAPPATAPHSPSFTINQCSQCHSHFNTNGTLNDNTKHIDGTVQAAGGCNSCHAYPPTPGDGFPYRDEPVEEGKGAHVKHIANIAAAKGVTLDPANDTFGTGTAGIVCGTCHSNDSANHMSGTRVINFNSSNEYMFGLNAPIYNGIPGTSSTVTMKSCSNISCHYGNSPGWQDPATAGQ